MVGNDGEHLRGANVGRSASAPTRLAHASAVRGGRHGFHVHRSRRRRYGPAQRAISISHGDIGGVRAAIAHWHSEPLHGVQPRVGPHFSGRFQKRKHQRVGGGNDGKRLGGMQLRDRAGRSRGRCCIRREIGKRAENRLCVQILERIAYDDLPAQRLCARFEHR